MVVYCSALNRVIPLSGVSYSLAGQTAHSGHLHALLSASVIIMSSKSHLGSVYFNINSNLIVMSGVILPF